MALKDFFLIEDKQERAWVIWLSVAIFFLSTASVMLTKLLEAFVIKRIGVEFLPFIHIIGAVTVVFGAWLSLSVLRRWRSQAQGAIFGIVSVVGAFILALSQGFFTEERGVVFNLIFVFLGVLVGTMAATNAYEKIRGAVVDIFDYEQLHRLEPIFASVVTLSVLTAGLLLAGLSAQISLGSMYMLVAAILAASIPAYMMLGRMSGTLKAQAVPEQSSKVGFLATLSLKNHIPNGRLRRFIMLLAIIVGLSVIFSEIFQYAFAVVGDARYSSEEELNAFFGGYVFLLSLVGLIFINVFQGKLFEKYGLTNNLYTPPVVVMMASIFMFAYPFFWVVIGVVFTREIIIGVQDTAYKAMMEGVNDYQRKQAWAWIRGPAHSVFGLLGAGLLLAVGYLFLPQGTAVTIKVLAVIAVVLLLVRFLLTMRFKKAYPGILLDAMGRGDFKTRLRAIEAMVEMRYMKDRHLGKVLDIIQDEEEPTAVRMTALKAIGKIKDSSVLRVVSRFVNHPDAKIRGAAIKAIAAFDYDTDKLYESGFSRHTLIKELRKLMPEEKDEDVTNVILDALIALRDPDIITHLIESLKTAEASTRHSVLRSMKKFKDPAIIDYVKPYLEDPVPHVKAQAVIAIWQFPWERQSYLRRTVSEMLKQDKSSDEYRQGLYLAGALQLKKYRKTLIGALRSESMPIRLAAAISLFKLGDNTGLTVARDVMANGDDKTAHQIIRLRNHYHIAEAQRAVIESLIHRYHLHYPQDLPVSEPLRTRIVDIPKLCLEGLQAYYTGPAAAMDRLKISRALQRDTFPENKGRVILAAISTPWREMAAIALLAEGYLVREAEIDEEFDETAIVISEVQGDKFPTNTIYLDESASDIGIGHVTKSHYAPSELVTEVDKLAL